MDAQNPIDLKGAKVLIVDDVPANLKVLRGVLEPEGFRILFAPRGEVALKIARSESPDLILLTARPLETENRRLGGLEARAVVSKPIRRSQLIRALRRAANPDEPEFETAGASSDFDPLLAGRHPLRILLADDYISKPVEISEVRRALEQSGNQIGAIAVANSGSMPQEKPSESPIDWTRLKKMLGEDRGVVRDFVELYLRQTSAQLAQLSGAVIAENASDAANLAHRCKGASATCGIHAMAEPMARLERAAKSQDWPSGSRHLTEAQEAFANVEKLLIDRFRSSEPPGD